MYEITHGGTWFKWSSLDSTDKRLAALSIVTAVPPAFGLGISVGAYAFQLGSRLSSGGHLPASSGAAAALLTPPVVLAAFACAIVSAIAWWLFSRRQDEMLNRIQNEALGKGCAWTVAAAGCWWFLESAAILPPLRPEALMVVALALVCLFWLRAVRRWA